MPGNEDYLDSLLKMAQQDIAPDSAINRVKQMAEEAEAAEEAIEEPVVEETAVEEPSLEEAPETTEEPLEIEDSGVIEEPLEIEDPGVIEEPVVVVEPIIEEPLADVEMPSEEDISDLLNSLGDITAEEPAEEEPVVTEETVPEEETISQDDIASLLESIGDISTEEPVAEGPIVAEESAVEEPVIEESVVEEPVVEEAPADPNAMLSADQIAAMFESVNATEEPVVVEEPVVEEEPNAEETIVSEEPPVEEPVIEEPVAEEPASEEQSILDEVTGEVEVPIEELPLDDVLSAEATEEPAAEEPAEEIVSDEIPGDVLEQPSEEASTEEEADEEGSLDLDALLEGLDAEDKSEAEKVEMTNTLDTVPGSDESMSDLSQEDIEKLLNDAKNVEDESEPQGEVEVDMNDLSQLESLGVFDKDADLSELGESSEELDEISSLLKTADNNDFSLNEDDDLMNLLSMESKRQAEEEEAAKKAESENASEEDSEGKDKKKKKKKEKGKKKKGAIPEDLEGEIDIDALNEAIPEKKQSAFSKFISFMTASDEDAPATSAEGENGEFGFEGVQGENKEILDEIDKEGDKKGKKKPKKDKKAKKGAAKEGDEGGDEGDEEGGGKKKKKPKKEKVKKEKTPKEEEPDNSKPLNKKNVKKIFIMAATLLLLLMLFIKLVPAMINKEQARKAYYMGDYETTYTALFGEKLSEGDQLLFDRSEIILKMSHKYDAFLSYNRMGMRTEALDQLLQAVARYEEWLYIAEVCGCKDAFNAEYEKIVTALGVTYDLTLDRAKEINAMPTDLEYSLMVESIANHTEYIDPNAPLPEPFVPEPDPLEMNFEDVLPEEQL